MYIVSYCAADVIRGIEIAASSKLEAWEKAIEQGVNCNDIIDIFIWRGRK